MIFLTEVVSMGGLCKSAEIGSKSRPSGVIAAALMVPSSASCEQ
jgi:hypothetical protein